jgi:hypothetical protein
MASNQMTLEQLKEQVFRLPPQEQLDLVVYISERLSSILRALPDQVDQEALRRQREQEADEILSIIDAAAEMSEGQFDAAEEIRQMRRDRDEQIWPSKS